MTKLDAFRAAWLTGRRAGAKRTLYRLNRLWRTRLLNPRLGSRLYPLRSVEGEWMGDSAEIQRACLRRLAQNRTVANEPPAWQVGDRTLTLLNQSPVSLQPPVRWQQTPIADGLWQFQLHGWEWAWPQLLNPAACAPLIGLWRDWIDQNRPGKGMAWEAYPTSRRLVVWCGAYFLVNPDPQLAAAILQQAAFLSRHLERDLDNNHLIANAKALAWVGLLFPPHPQAARYRDEGLALLWRLLIEQVGMDGGHLENSTSYHKGVWLDGLETVALCRASGVSVPVEVDHVLQKMGEFALAMQRPDGRLPLLNDSIQDEPLPLTHLFALSAELYERPDFAAAAAGELVVRDSAELRDSGYVVIRTSNQTPRPIYLLFDGGDIGLPYCPGHGHADTLAFELWFGEQPLLIDPGTYQYPAGRWRDAFRGTLAHNTAQVDGVEQSEFIGAFRLGHIAHAKLGSVNLGGACQSVSASHDGYTRLSDPVVHARELRWEGLTGEVVDRFSGAADHDVTLAFHATEGASVAVGETSAEIAYPDGTRLQLTVSAPAAGRFHLETGWASAHWYQKVETPVLLFSTRSRFPAQITTTLRILP